MESCMLNIHDQFYAMRLGQQEREKGVSEAAALTRLSSIYPADMLEDAKRFFIPAFKGE